MSYTKNIAVINGLKDGFSADGGKLSGLVKAEKYYQNLKVEISLLNFAPLSEGRYVAAITDGNTVQIVEGNLFEGSSKLNTSAGFAAMIFYVNGRVEPIASAICGDFAAYALTLKGEVERLEGGKQPAKPTQKNSEKYSDDAIAEENYYEYDQTGGADGQTDKDGEPVCGGKEQKDGQGAEKDEEDYGPVQKPQLARGGFFERIRAETEQLFKTYPPCEEL